MRFERRWMGYYVNVGRNRSTGPFTNEIFFAAHRPEEATQRRATLPQGVNHGCEQNHVACALRLAIFFSLGESLCGEPSDIGESHPLNLENRLSHVFYLVRHAIKTVCSSVFGVCSLRCANDSFSRFRPHAVDCCAASRHIGAVHSLPPLYLGVL